MRFIVNLPLEELESMERICFQVEEAQWFYEDFVRPLDPKLPSLNLRQFSMKIFQHCPLFAGHGEETYATAFSEFMAYKTRVPVRGAILLNEALDQVILVKGWKKGANWSFPRGKINKDEEDIDCAIREVYEETGFDVQAAGLVASKDEVKSIDVTMREQNMKLFVFSGVDMETHFEPRTRKEISAIQWYKLSELPTLKKVKNQHENGSHNGVNANKFYMVAPFLRPLKRIIGQLKKEKAASTPAPAMLEPLHTISSALPEQIAYNQLPSGNDLSRLMAQLRQSSQASREMNYPEVSDHTAIPDISPFDPDNLPAPLAHAEDPLYEAQRAAARRESKANAMLSLLRSGPSASSAFNMSNIAPQTPLEQMTGRPSQPPPSPKSHSVRTARLTDLPAPPVFEVSPEQISRHSFPSRQEALRQPPTLRPLVHASTPEQQSLLPSFLRDQSHAYRPQGQIAGPPTAKTGDSAFSQTSRPLGGQHASVAPHASKLPPPKLNAHSSNLLSLFKTGQPPPLNTMVASASLLPAGETTRPELSPSSAGFFRSQTTPLVSMTSPAMLSSTPALISPTTSLQDVSKRSSHQETLLNLFRQPKPSPSLAPPLAPVELSAQGSPTHSRVSSDFARKEKAAIRAAANGDSRAMRRIELSSTPSETRVSATISGPLNVPQFDKILQRPGAPDSSVKIANFAASSAHGPELPQQPQSQAPVKILSRPGTENKPSAVPALVSQPASPRIRKSPQRKQHKSNAAAKDLPFQPRILKRPESARQGAEQTVLRSHPPTLGGEGPSAVYETPPSLASDETPLPRAPILDRRASQTPDQKAALLSLFGKTSTQVAPAHAPSPASVPANAAVVGRRGSVVSPLSEKPPVGSNLPSPMGAGKSRLGSLQGERVPLIRTKSGDMTQSLTSPLDKKFLLGYLDSVASQGRP